MLRLPALARCRASSISGGSLARTQKLTPSLLILLILVSTLAMSSAPIPRESPEFNIQEPSGKHILLSSLRGKVVVLEFFFIQSDHCIRVAKTLNGLGSEMG